MKIQTLEDLKRCKLGTIVKAGGYRYVRVSHNVSVTHDGLTHNSGANDWPWLGIDCPKGYNGLSSHRWILNKGDVTLVDGAITPKPLGVGDKITLPRCDELTPGSVVELVSHSTGKVKAVLHVDEYHKLRFATGAEFDVILTSEFLRIAYIYNGS